jgi:transposase-like protein
MPRAGPRNVGRYSDEFKRTAVRLSQQPGILVQTVAAALEHHPFMLSKWRRDAKTGRLRGRPPKPPHPGRLARSPNSKRSSANTPSSKRSTIS